MNGIKLIEFKPVVRGGLRGFAKVELLQTGLTIGEIPVHVTHTGKLWAGLPGKPMLDHDKQLVRDQHGKIQYSKFLAWRDGRIASAFSNAVIAAIRDAGHQLDAGEQP